jgi:DNA polymerase-3 subunit epsilon
MSASSTNIQSGKSVSLQLSALPDTVGVYLFFSERNYPLYIGKSITLRSRVRAHFAAREERAMCRQVGRIEIRETAGELGALLLESHLIKELRPMYNHALKQQRRLIVARGMENEFGYTVVRLEPVIAIKFEESKPILGLFKTKLQASEFLSGIAKSHRLCLKLLGLEQTKRHCFGYHLQQCNGACMNEESAAEYNHRLESAFDERRIKAWPFKGAILIEEKSEDGKRGEVFVVDNWSLLYSFTYSGAARDLRIRGSHRFDYDSYKILASYVFEKKNAQTIREVNVLELKKLISTLKAA